jgi:hypothetical protein
MPKFTLKKDSSSNALCDNSNNGFITHDFINKSTISDTAARLFKTKIDGVHDSFLKNFIEKYVEYSNNSKYNDTKSKTKIDYYQMIKGKNKPLLLDELKINDNSNKIIPTTNNLDIQDSKTLNFENNSYYNPLKNELDDDKQLFHSNASPNPLCEDLNFNNNSDIFNSSRSMDLKQDTNENNFIYNIPKMLNNIGDNSDENKNNINSMNIIENFQIGGNTRKSSFDWNVNDMFKNNDINIEDDNSNRKYMGENNFFDDCIFSITPDRNNKEQIK